MARETVCCAPLNDDETRRHIVFLSEVYRKALWDRLNTSSGGKLEYLFILICLFKTKEEFTFFSVIYSLLTGTEFPRIE